jgi:hypothetical protein
MSYEQRMHRSEAKYATRKALGPSLNFTDESYEAMKKEMSRRRRDETYGRGGTAHVTPNPNMHAGGNQNLHKTGYHQERRPVYSEAPTMVGLAVFAAHATSKPNIQVQTDDSPFYRGTDYHHEGNRGHPRAPHGKPRSNNDNRTTDYHQERSPVGPEVSREKEDLNRRIVASPSFRNAVTVRTHLPVYSSNGITNDMSGIGDMLLHVEEYKKKHGLPGTLPDGLDRPASRPVTPETDVQQAFSPPQPSFSQTQPLFTPSQPLFTPSQPLSTPPQPLTSKFSWSTLDSKDAAQASSTSSKKSRGSWGSKLKKSEGAAQVSSSSSKDSKGTKGSILKRANPLMSKFILSSADGSEEEE